MTTIRLYMDEHVPSKVTEAMRRLGIDVMTAQEARRVGTDDDQHLAFASEHQRVLVTQDKDFIELHYAGAVHRGIIHCPQGTSVRAFIRGFRLVCDCMTAEEIGGTVHYL